MFTPDILHIKPQDWLKSLIITFYDMGFEVIESEELAMQAFAVACENIEFSEDRPKSIKDFYVKIRKELGDFTLEDSYLTGGDDQTN